MEEARIDGFFTHKLIIGIDKKFLDWRARKETLYFVSLPGPVTEEEQNITQGSSITTTAQQSVVVHRPVLFEAPRLLLSGASLPQKEINLLS